MNTIYEDVLNFVGVLHDSDPESNKVVKTQIGLAIDTALGILVQNGIGHTCSVVTNPDLTWSDFSMDISMIWMKVLNDGLIICLLLRRLSV